VNWPPRCGDVDLYTESSAVFGKGRKKGLPGWRPALEASQKYRSAANVHSGASSLTNHGNEFRRVDLADLETLFTTTFDSISISRTNFDTVLPPHARSRRDLRSVQALLGHASLQRPKYTRT